MNSEEYYITSNKSNDLLDKLISKSFSSIHLIDTLNASEDELSNKEDEINYDNPFLTNDASIFINSSIQLLQCQSDARQKIRHLWFAIQRLHWDNHIDKKAVDFLHNELLSLNKKISLEDSMNDVNSTNKYVMTGYLTLVNASIIENQIINPAITGSSTSPLPHNKIKENPIGKTFLNNKFLFVIRKDQLKLEVSIDQNNIPKKQDNNINFPKFSLPSTLNWLKTENNIKPGTDTISIDLFGSHCDEIAASNRFQIITAAKETIATDRNILNLFEKYVFETESIDETQRWINTIEEIGHSKLWEISNYMNQDDSTYKFKFKTKKENFFSFLRKKMPLIISLRYLRYLVYRNEKKKKFQETARRNSKNMPFSQIARDLKRDKILLNNKLITGNEEGIQILIKDIVLNLFQFFSLHYSANEYKHDPATLSNLNIMQKETELHIDANLIERNKYLENEIETDITKGKEGSDTIKNIKTQGLSSKKNKIKFSSSTNEEKNKIEYKNLEAKALSFVERVLRGSSRTQTGGDIYDAISATLMNNTNNYIICPVSNEVEPVRLDTKIYPNSFTILVTVKMDFKIIHEDGNEYIDIHDNDTIQKDKDTVGIICGTLHRTFIYGNVGEPGTVTLDWADNHIA